MTSGRSGRTRRRVRHAGVVVHRWTGLLIAAFLVVSGATGSLLAFDEELEAWVSPQLFTSRPPHAGAPALDPFELRESVLRAHPTVAINWVDLAPRPGRSVTFGLEPARADTDIPGNDQVFVDPYTGKLLGERRQGDLKQGWVNFMPFVFSLHQSLAMGPIGTYALGVAALLWTVDCFLGLYLTFPLRRLRTAEGTPPRRRPAQWLRRWTPAWAVRRGAPHEKQVFDLHRAAGLWMWAMLLVLAWTGVGFNLPEVYRPAMRWMLGYAEESIPPRPGADSLDRPVMGWPAARRIAAAEMARLATDEGFVVRRERLLHLDAERHLFEYRVLSSLDPGDKLGNTTLFIDATTGAFLHLDRPTGRSIGNTVDTWAMAIHTASFGGASMQAFVCGAGLFVVLVTVTGVLIWWRRRLARRQERSAARPVTAPG